VNEASNPPAPQAQPAQTIQVALPALAPIVTYALLGFTVFVYLMQVLSVAIFGYAVNGVDWLEVFGARITGLIQTGQLWRFITPVFLHGSPAHIFFNMYALLSIGSFIERQFGHKRFLLLYFLGAFSGNVFSFLFGSKNGLSVGASTAIFGLIAAQGIFFYQNRKLFGNQAQRALSNTAFIIAINLFIGLSPGIDNWGHVGGLLGGAIFSWFAGTHWAVIGIPPLLHLEDQRETREIVTGAGLVLILFGMLALWGIIFK
jgi:rhomboid protease GluP